MCPEHQIHSLYIDDELPSPWKEKFELHLGSCPVCQAYLERYKKLRTVMTDDRAVIAPEQESGVWNRIIAGNNGATVNVGNRNTGNRAFWNRSVSLPVPAAAAAAAVFVVITMLAIQGIRGPLETRGTQRADSMGIAAVAGSEAGNIAQISDMNDVLQFLTREEASDFIIMNLPETSSFSRVGDPALVRAVDYSGGLSSR